MGKIWKAILEAERKEQERQQLRKEMKKEWERTNLCAICKKKYSGDGYPYKLDFWGKPKSFICSQCHQGF